MNTGVACTASPDCSHPAPFGTRICHVHQRAARLAAMRAAPSAGIRALGYAFTLLARQDPEHEAGG